MKIITKYCLSVTRIAKKTTFNLLTGSKTKTGNWPGVTVDKKTEHSDGQASLPK